MSAGHPERNRQRSTMDEWIDFAFHFSFSDLKKALS